MKVPSTRSGLFAAILASICSAATAAQPEPPGAIAAAGNLARPSPQQIAWHDLEIGMFIHIAPQTWQDSETDTLATPLADINPDKLDTDQWVRVAKSMGAQYIVFVAKHEGGFCWWQTDTTDFSVGHTPWRGGKGDVLAELSKSCKAAGMKLGVYISPQDRKHGVEVGGKAKDPSKQAEYEKLFREQLTEVLSRYGDMIEVWFDGSLVFDVGEIVAKHAPNAVVFQGPQASIRWVGNEEGLAPYPAWNSVKFPQADRKWGDYTAEDGDPDGNRWLPNECDSRIRSTWFWKTNNANTVKSLTQLMSMYEQSVGHGAVMLLNNTPDRSGLIPETDAARSAEFGAELKRRFGVATADVAGTGKTTQVTLSTPTMIEWIVSMEDVAQGERVRSYTIEALINGQWKAVAEGSAIGHKKIDRITPTKVEAVRLVVQKSVGEPVIRKLAVYRAVAHPADVGGH